MNHLAAKSDEELASKFQISSLFQFKAILSPTINPSLNPPGPPSTPELRSAESSDLS